MTKKQAYINIKSDVAKHGRVTKQSMGFYCESRLSKKDFEKAVSIGKESYDKRINNIGKNTLDISIHGKSEGY